MPVPFAGHYAGYRQIDVYLLPALVEPAELAGQTVVVIDVLRATTTIIHALAAGATQVVPCLEVDEARQRARLSSAATPFSAANAAGSRSPASTWAIRPPNTRRERVGGKTMVFTTTNGTRAMLRCQAASRVLIGAFVNFSAVCRELADERADRPGLRRHRRPRHARRRAAWPARSWMT